MKTYLNQLLKSSVNRFEIKNDDRFDKKLKPKNMQTWCKIKCDEKASQFEIANVHGKSMFFTDLILMDDHKRNEKKDKKKETEVWHNTAWIIDTKEKQFKCNEFFHEVAIATLVKLHLEDIPMFSKSKIMDAYFDKSNCIIGFQNVKDSLEFEHVANSLNTEDFINIVIQVLASLWIGQERIQLKHHDMHLGNVMITQNTDSVQTIQIKAKGKSLEIPIKNYHATIIDYGLSSATDPESSLRHCRLDEELLIKKTRSEQEDERGESISTLSDEWGVWGQELQDDEGYDVAMFVESLTEELFKARPLQIEKLKIVSELQALTNINFTERGRPAERCTIDWNKVFRIFNIEIQDKTEDVKMD